MSRGDGPALICAVLAIAVVMGLMTVPISCEAQRTPPTLQPLPTVNRLPVGTLPPGASSAP